MTILVEPRFEPESRKRSIAVIEPPQVPAAENVKGWLTIAPAGTTPYVCGALGAVTPLVPKSVTTRFVVGPVPKFLKANVMVTVSPGSMALLVGAQPSRTSALESSTTTGLL